MQHKSSHLPKVKQAKIPTTQIKKMSAMAESYQQYLSWQMPDYVLHLHPTEKFLMHAHN